MKAIKKMFGMVVMLWFVIRFKDSWRSEPPLVNPQRNDGDRRKGVRWNESLSALLDVLDDVFQKVQIRDAEKWSWVDRDTRRALRKIGPHVSSVWVDPPPGGGPVFVDTKEKLSTVMFVSIHGDGPDDPEKMNPSFVYALRHSKEPWYVEGRGRSSGIPFECGIAYHFHGRRDLLFWSRFFVIVDERTGEVRLRRELTDTWVQLPNGGGYTRKEWKRNEFADRIRSEYHKDGEHELAWGFAALCKFWSERHERWSVSASKGRERATFCIDQTEPKHYFKERDKTALTPRGRRRPIIHHVEEHERVLANGRRTTVREHLRGLRVFDWMGYRCAVNAPRYHFLSSQFDLGAIEVDGAKPVGMIDVSGLAGRLVEMEDAGRVLAR